ncbi:hypothetical protein GBAR_LOCUS22325 [Geodia barretti]|uniref:Uncharacterized protein n=1 Tax=Geodia barretti TaxID=519541 RepID=A0AA35X6K5_GEOBA|nr:hypothetical protein GBAR_LOCUS22325 [Geodia barretti]
MASQSELYKHLWEPKKTTRDWGTTEYRIIRTWTPRAPPSIDQSEAGQSHYNQPDSPHYEPGGGSDSGGEMEEEEGAYLGTPSSSLQSLQRGLPPTAAGESNGRTTETTEATTETFETTRNTKETTEATRNTKETTEATRNTTEATNETTEATKHTSVETVSLSIRMGPVAAVWEGVQRSTRRLRPRPHQDSDEAEIKGQEEEKDATNESSENEDPQPTTVTVKSSGHKSQHVPPSLQKTPQPATGGGARAAPAILASETDTGTESDPENVMDRLPESQKATRKGRKRASAKSSQFTLWLSAYQRTGRDLNELDICLSTYDSFMREAIQDEGDAEVQRAMVRHWKLTRKHMLSTIRDISAVSALEKRHRQEVTKNKKLQKESALMISRLRKYGKLVVKSCLHNNF